MSQGLGKTLCVSTGTQKNYKRRMRQIRKHIKHRPEDLEETFRAASPLYRQKDLLFTYLQKKKYVENMRKYVAYMEKYVENLKTYETDMKKYYTQPGELGEISSFPLIHMTHGKITSLSPL